MNKAITYNPLVKSAARYLVIIASLLMMFAMFNVAYQSQTAFAVPPVIGGDNSGPPSQGTPIENVESPGGSLNPNPPSPGSGSNPGAGTPGTGSGDPYAYTTRWPIGVNCAVRDDGKKAVATDIYYTKQFRSGKDEDTPPAGSGWRYQGYMPNYGYRFERTIETGRNCLYPPRVYYKNVACSIRYYVEIARVTPSPKSFGTGSAGTGYAEGSRDYNACINSRGFASLYKPVTEYGYYNVNAWQRTANARVEIAYTRNEATGELPAPKIVSLTPAYNTVKRVLQTASLDCKNGFRTPGVKLSDWSEKPCQNSVPGSAMCNAKSVSFDVAPGSNSTTMRSYPNNTIQFLRDGKARKILFNQNVAGSQIKVNSQSTTFSRTAGSTPWSNSMAYNKNLFTLGATKSGSNILSKSNGTASVAFSGNKKDVWASALSASSSGAPTKISQSIAWKGTRTIKSGVVTGVNPNTGQVNFGTITVAVPTSGLCTQTAIIDYVRSVGDTINYN